MLNINNGNDILNMMKYHRTKDMINLMTYFPELSPIRNLTIVTSIEDYLENYNFCKNLPGERNDTLITRPCMKSLSGKGIDPDIISIFKEVKKMDSDGVMILFDLCHEPSERYERYADIAVRVSLGDGVLIDAVGKGFDGNEVSKGLASHERYYIPWFELRKCNIENFKNYRTYLISDSKYQKSRMDRIKFLTSIGLSEEIVEANIPNQYQEIPDFIWLDVIKNLLKKLEKMEDMLASVKLNEFVISGHTEGKSFFPWQMFDDSRFGLVKRR